MREQAKLVKSISKAGSAVRANERKDLSTQRADFTVALTADHRTVGKMTMKSTRRVLGHSPMGKYFLSTE